MAIIGNTVTFSCNFYIDGILTDPDEDTIYFTTYNSSPYKIIQQTLLTNENRVSIGVYSIDYIIPCPIGDMIYEFSGTILDKPRIYRTTITRTLT
jgi:hypothetical protein